MKGGYVRLKTNIKLVNMANIEQKVEELLTQTINQLGYEIYDILYEKEAKDHYLRIFIDKNEGISLEDCETVNNAITDILDEADYIHEPYFLEVSSPGVERRLRKDKHYTAYKGKEIVLNLFEPIILENKEEAHKKKNTTKQLEGILKEFNNNTLILIVENKEILVERKNIANCKAKFNWK